MRLFDSGRTTWYISPEAVLAIPLFLILVPLRDAAVILSAFILHETTHFVTAKSLGCTVSEFRLLAFGGTIRLENAGVSELLQIALAAPVANIAAAGVLALWIRWMPSQEILSSFLLTNLYLGVWNLLPIEPMDGGRVLHGLLDRVCSLQSARLFTLLISSLTALFLIGWSLYSLYRGQNTWPYILSYSVMLLETGLTFFRNRTTPMELCLHHNAMLLEGKPIPVRPVAVRSSERLITATRAFLHGKYTVLLLLGKNGEARGTWTEDQLMKAIAKHGSLATFEEILD